MTQDFVADLHNHTTASDGEYSPSELIQKAKALNLAAIGVTDHDTLNGLDEALAAGQQLSIQVVPGVEVSLRFKRPYFVGTLHYLLYIPYLLLADTRLPVNRARAFSMRWLVMAASPNAALNILLYAVS